MVQGANGSVLRYLLVLHRTAPVYNKLDYLIDSVYD